MKKVGLWIDHRQARIVTIEDGRIRLRTIASHVGRKTRLAGGSRSSGFIGEIAPEKKREARHLHRLTRFYERVIGALHDVDRILILGPGEAKLELEEKVRESKHLAERIAAVATADKMTQRQLMAKVKAFFFPTAKTNAN